jgi:hypothetical protein
MVIAPVAAAVAPAVVDSATNDEGLINKLFKIGVLIGFLVLAAISIVILSFIIEIADVVGAAFNVFSVALNVLSVGGLPGPLAPLGVAATFLFSAFGFGGRS